MNNRIYFFSCALFFCFMPLSLFSMHNIFFRGMQVVSAGALILPGAYNVFMYKKNKEKRQKYYNSLKNMPIEVEMHVRKVLKEAGVQQANSILTKIEDDAKSWEVVENRMIASNNQDIEELRESLLIIKQAETAEAARIENMKQKRASKKSRSLFSCRYSNNNNGPKNGQNNNSPSQEQIDAYKKRAKHEWILWHESKHLIANDNKKKLEIVMLLPSLVQVASWRLTILFNMLLNRKSPSNWRASLCRSFLSMASIIPKYAIYWGGSSIVSKNLERKADRLAFENAKSRLHLEMAHKNFLHLEDERKQKIVDFMLDVLKKKRQGQGKETAELPEGKSVMPEELDGDTVEIIDGWTTIFDFGDYLFGSHPAAIDRAAMAVEYIKDWDKNH